MGAGKMRRLFSAAMGLVATFALVGLCGCSLFTPTLSEVEDTTVEQTVDDSLLVQPGTLTVAVNTSDAPQAMVSADGSTEGYAVDVASALAQRMGLKLSIVHAISPSDAIGAGTADVYLGAVATDETDAVSVMGDYLENATAIFGVGTSGSVITSDNLASGVIGVQESSASQEALAQAGIASEQQTYSNVNECFEALAAGEVNYVACDATAGAYLARAYPDVTFMGTVSATTVYGLALNSSSTELIESVQTAFEGIAADGTLDAIHAVWYGSLPLSLSDQVISGVTVEATEDSEASDSSEVITHDINNPS